MHPMAKLCGNSRLIMMITTIMLRLTLIFFLIPRKEVTDVSKPYNHVI